jgi:hypothetical protein
MADLAIAADDAELVDEILAAEDTVGDRHRGLAAIVRMKRALPGLRIRLSFKAVNADHAVVPAHVGGLEIDLENADARYIEGKFQPTGHLCEPFFRLLVLGDVRVRASDTAWLAVRAVLDDRTAALDPDPVSVSVAFAVAEDVEGCFAAFLLGDFGKHMRPVVRMHGQDPGVERGVDRIIRPQAADGAPLAGVEEVAAREIMVPDALAGGFQRVIPAALPFRQFECIVLAFVDIDRLDDHGRAQRLAGKGGRLDEGGEHPEFAAIRPQQADFQGACSARCGRIAKAMAGRSLGETQSVKAGRSAKDATPNARSRLGIRIDDAAVRIERCKTEAGARKKLAIKTARAPLLARQWRSNRKVWP